MTVKEIQQYVYDFLYDKGTPHVTICAIMGNIAGESGFDPDSVEIGNSIGFGLCQWSFGRRTQLEAYGTSLRHQCEFLWSELTGENLSVTGADYQWITPVHESVDGGEGFHFSNDDFMDGNGSVALLTKAFCYCWERPAYETNHLESFRIPEAEEFYQTMSYQNSGNVPDDPPIGGGGEVLWKVKKSSFKFILFARNRKR